MTAWHLINNDGDIVRTVTASSRADAVALLGRGGTVVSALSWRLDYHKWQPVRTVVTDVVQVQQKTGAPKLRDGLIGTAQTAQRLGITERRLRYLSKRHRITPQRIPYGQRHIYAYTPLQVHALRDILHHSSSETDA